MFQVRRTGHSVPVSAVLLKQGFSHLLDHLLVVLDDLGKQSLSCLLVARDDPGKRSLACLLVVLDDPGKRPASPENPETGVVRSPRAVTESVKLEALLAKAQLTRDTSGETSLQMPFRMQTRITNQRGRQ